MSLFYGQEIGWLYYRRVSAIRERIEQNIFPWRKGYIQFSRKEIIVENGKATGIRLENGKRYNGAILFRLRRYDTIYRMLKESILHFD